MAMLTPAQDKTAVTPVRHKIRYVCRGILVIMPRSRIFESSY
jgi:hypothetical protein